MTNPYIALGPPGDTTNRTPKMLSGFRSLPVVNGDPPPVPVGTVGLVADLTMAAGDSDTTLTDQPSAEDDTWFPRSLWWDTRPFNRIRIVIDDVKTVGATNSRLIAKFATSKANALAGTFAHGGVGGTEVSASMAELGPSKSAAWAVINSAAINNVLWRVFAIGGDGALDPVVSGVHIQFLQGAPADPCGGVGCPMPAAIYNGEDFSSYADEATFIAFVEGESNNFYSSWYGDDYEETCEFDPGLTFCGNPVVVGRWQGVSDGSPSWARTGYGGTTRFSNPVGDDGSPSFRVQFKSVWATMRFKIEDGWNTGTGTPGFLVSEIFNTNGFVGSMGVYIRDDRLIMRGRATTGDPTVDIDIGPASMIIGTSDFVEVTLHGVLSPVVSGLCTMTVEVFINPACSGGSAGEINTATPLATYTKTSATAGDPKFNNWDKFDVTSTDTQWPEKRIWVAQAFYSGSLT